MQISQLQLLLALGISIFPLKVNNKQLLDTNKNW